MPERSLTIDQVLTLLRENPARMAALTAGLSREQLHAAPAPGEWSFNDILAHLRSCADVWGGCMARILDEDHPTIRATNPRTWVKKTDYHEQDFQTSFHAFAAQRATLLAALEPLAPEEWSRAATVTGAGKVLERTVHFYAQWLAEHERSHVKQIGRLARDIGQST
jgi:hypothetical protein